MPRNLVRALESWRQERMQRRFGQDAPGEDDEDAWQSKPRISIRHPYTHVQ
jgi:hypothetical protein